MPCKMELYCHFYHMIMECYEDVGDMNWRD